MLKTRLRARVRYDDVATEMGTTIGSISSKANRLGIGTGSNYEDAARQQRHHAIRARLQRGEAEQISPEMIAAKMNMLLEDARCPQEFRIDLIDTQDDGCRYIHGDTDSAHGYCPRTKVEGTSWCAHHGKMVFGTVEVSERRLRQQSRVAMLVTT